MLWCLAAKIAFMYSAHTYIPRCCGLTCFIGWAGPASVTETVLVSNLVHLVCCRLGLSESILEVGCCIHS